MTTRARVLDTIDLTDAELFRQGFPHEVFAILRDVLIGFCHGGIELNAPGQ